MRVNGDANGDGRSDMSDDPDGGADFTSLSARVEVVLAHVRQASHDANLAREAAERCEDDLRGLRQTLRRVADDQMELRAGIPPAGTDRLILVALAASVGAVIGAVMGWLIRFVG